MLALVSGALAGIPLALATLVLARAFPSAAVRYAIVATAFGVAAAQPLVAVVLSAYAAPHANLALPLERRLAGLGSPGPLWAVIGTVTIVLLADVGLAFARLLRVKRGARVAAEFAPGVRRAPVAYSSAVESATAIGYRRPRVVLPAGIEARVDGCELRAIIAHENAHLARYDDWAKAVQAILVRALWFAPALWILARRLDLERELASDERVAATLAPRAYAACLLRLAVDVPGRHVAPAAWRGRAQIAVRVEALLRPARELGTAGAALRLGALAAAIVLGVLGAGVLAPAGLPNAPLVARHTTTAPGAGQHALAHDRPAARAPQRVAAVRPALAHAPGAAAAASLAPSPGRRPATHAAQPLPVAVLPLALEPGAPCRTCVMLRRPVSDGPARIRTAPTAKPAQASLPEPAGPAARGSEGDPRDPNSLASSWAELLY